MIARSKIVLIALANKKAADHYDQRLSQNSTKRNLFEEFLDLVSP